MREFDINSDLSERYGAWTIGDDAATPEVARRVRIARGLHIGDPNVIFRTLTMAAVRHVAVGAQVWYRDLAGFGRRNMDGPSKELFSEAIYQIGVIKASAEAARTRVTFVKPRGALCNPIAFDAPQAAEIITTIKAVNPALTLMALAGSPLIAQAHTAVLNRVEEALRIAPTGRTVSLFRSLKRVRSCVVPNQWRKV